MSFTPGSTHGQMASINMTPLIDVMLVLLIIFMIAAPMLTTGVDVKLPESHTGRNLESEALTVSITFDGRLQFGQAAAAQRQQRRIQGHSAIQNVFRQGIAEFRPPQNRCHPDWIHLAYRRRQFRPFVAEDQIRDQVGVSDDHGPRE